MTEFVKKLRSKGWTAQELAKRWGVSPRRISQIGNDPQQKDWDALAGLPGKKSEPKAI
ncbi:MAG: XRE family transcriptional regulator [Bacteroidia bacterium]|nr:XRE family transcriptional regulator [Bacteroidia bacterium]